MSLENLRQNRYLTAEFVHNTTQRLDFYQYNPMHIIVEITSINSKNVHAIWSDPEKSTSKSVAT